MKSRKEELLSRLRNTLAIAGIEHLMDNQAALQPATAGPAAAAPAQPASLPAAAGRSESPGRQRFGWSEQGESRSNQAFGERGRGGGAYIAAGQFLVLRLYLLAGSWSWGLKMFCTQLSCILWPGASGWLAGMERWMNWIRLS